MNNKTLWHNPHFWRYIIGQTVSVFGDVLFKITVIWTAIDSTDSILPIAIMLFISYVPQLVVGLFGGYLIDRLDRRKVMIASDLLSALALLVLYIMHRGLGLSIVMLYVIRFVLSTMDVFYSPATMAYIPKIVEARHLVKANAVTRMVRQVVGIISAAAAGFIVMTLGLESIYLINGASFLFAGIMIATIPIAGTVDKPKENEGFRWKSLTAGFRYIRKDAFVLDFVILIFLCNMVYEMMYNLPSVYARDVLHMGVEGYGFIQTALSLGGIVGTIILGFIRSKRVGILFAISSIAGGVFIFLLGVTQAATLGIALYFLFSLTDALTIPCFTYLQLHVEDSIKGRVFAAFDTIVLFATPLASIFIALFVERLGVSQTYRLSGILLIMIAVFAFSRKAFRRADIGRYEVG